jgi:hypothetical protein
MSASSCHFKKKRKKELIIIATTDAEHRDFKPENCCHLFLSAVVTPFSEICTFNKKPSFTPEKPVPIVVSVFTKRARTDG